MRAHTEIREEGLLAEAGGHGALVALMEVALSPAPTDEFLMQAARTVRWALGRDICAVLRLDAGGAFSLAAHDGLDPALVVDERDIAPGRSHSASAVDASLPVVVEDWEQEDRFECSPTLAAHGVLCGASVALRYRGTVYGALTVYDRAVWPFTADELGFLQAAGQVIALAIESRAAEEAGRKVSNTLQTLIDNAPACIYVLDCAGTIVLVNRGVEQLLRTPRERLVGRRLEEVEALDEDFCAELSASIAAVARERTAITSEVAGPMEDGGRRQFLAARFPLIDAAGELYGVASISTDITERVKAHADRERLELELRLAHRLEAVGELAAGIAHEINTPMQYLGDTVSFVRGAVEDLLELTSEYQALRAAAGAGPVPTRLLDRIVEAEDLADLPYLSERLPLAFERAEDGIGRVSRIVGAMREFAHPPTMRMSPAALNDAIENTLIVAHNEYKYVAEVHLDLGDLPPVTCNIGDVNQVLLNLIVNAAHAIAEVIGEGGEKGRITIASRVDGEDAIVQVGDTGGGVREELRERIFDPFFTTKASGKGTGQGLAIARAIVQDRHSGTLTFESDPSRGTTFTMRLPLAGAPLPGEEARA